MRLKVVLVVVVLGMVVAVSSRAQDGEGDVASLALGSGSLSTPTVSTALEAQPPASSAEATVPTMAEQLGDGGISPEGDPMATPTNARPPTESRGAGATTATTTSGSKPAGTSSSGAVTSTSSVPPVDLSRFPGPHDTGVPPGVPLIPSGSLLIEEDGAVVDGMEVTGAIEVRASGVTIRRTRVLVNGAFGIKLAEGSDLLIEDVELVGVSGTLSVGISSHGSWTARRVNVHGFVDGIKVWNDQVVEDSYIHGLLVREGSHNDGIQSDGGQNVRILNNRIEGPYQYPTSAIIMGSSISGPLRNYRIEGNLLSGGGYTVYCNPAKAGVNPNPTGIVIRDNVWLVDSWRHGPAAITNTEMVFEGNRFSDGRPFLA